MTLANKQSPQVSERTTAIYGDQQHGGGGGAKVLRKRGPWQWYTPSYTVLLSHLFYHTPTFLECRSQTPLQPLSSHPSCHPPPKYTTPVIRSIKNETVTHFITGGRCLPHPRSITHRVISFWSPKCYHRGGGIHRHIRYYSSIQMSGRFWFVTYDDVIPADSSILCSRWKLFASSHYS